MALACDMRYISKSAKLGLTFAKLGLHPGMGGTFYLPQIVGPHHAARLLMTGDLISGEEACNIGMGTLVDGDSEACVQIALEAAKSIASSAPLTVQGVVKMLRMKQDVGVDQALQREADAQAQSYATKDYKIGLRAIASKEKPVFEGN